MPASQRVATSPRDEVFSLNVLAGKESGEPERMSQFRVLIRHFLDRFFGKEFASADGDAKTRLVQVVCAIGIPPLIASLYLYPVYHPPFHRVRPYWQQAGDHYFFVLYTMVAMGIIAIFEWDLLFPDLLDVFVLSSLPVRAGRLLRARITAILLLIAAAIFDSSFLPPLVLPAATDPPHLFRFLAAHCAAVACSGVFSASLFLAVEGLLLAFLGDRWFRRVSLWLQGLAVVALLTSLFLYPVIAGVLQDLLLSNGALASWFPPFWFLGMYQRMFDGPSSPPIFAHLAWIGACSTVAMAVLAMGFYPLAWRRRTAALVEGAAARQRQRRIETPVNGVLHASVLRVPGARAIWHFIGQNLLRVPRYRMVLVLYGGAGIALVLSSALRIAFSHGRMEAVISPDGLRAMVPIAAFWTVSGLRNTILAPADQRGRWIFRAILGKPAWVHVQGTRRWVLMWTMLLTLAAAALAIIAESQRVWRFAATQGFVAIALSLLLVDLFFLDIKTIPFTVSKPSTAANLAFLLIPYAGFFPAIVFFTVSAEPWLETSVAHIAVAAALVIGVHFLMLRFHKAHVVENLQQIEADDDQEEFPLRLGLRY
jgi:hypothetical protein